MGEPRDIEAIVLEIVATQFRVDRQRLSRQTRFKDLGADLLDLCELSMTLENECGLTPNERPRPIRVVTIGDLIDGYI